LAAVGVLVWGVATVQAQGDAKADSGVAAWVGGKPISMADVDAKALKTNMKLAQQIYDARRAALDEIIMERLLAEEAAAANMTPEQLIAKRVAEKIKPVTQAEIESFYNSNKGRMGGRTLEQVGPQIKSYLESQQSTAARKTVMDEAMSKGTVKIALEAPRADIVIADNDPMKGPKDAKVTIALYSDFQ